VDHLTELYCLIDDFCKEFEPAFNAKLIESGKRKRLRAAGLTSAELMTLVVLFHQLRYRQFKAFYLNHARLHLLNEFPKLPSYQRCIELMPRAAAGLAGLFASLKG
jgi:hypothetical protein